MYVYYYRTYTYLIYSFSVPVNYADEKYTFLPTQDFGAGGKVSEPCLADPVDWCCIFTYPCNIILLYFQNAY